MWDCLKAKLTNLITDHIPSKLTSTKSHQPWITTDTKRMLRKKQKWYYQAKNSTSKKVKQIYQKLKRDCQRACRNAHSDYVRSLVNENSNNKKLWNYIKSKKTENVGIADLNSGSKILTDPKEKANLLNNQFSSVFSTPDNKPTIPEVTTVPEIDPILVSRAGVLKLLLGIKEHKATGPDGIPGNLLKICAHEIVDAITLLFQTSLDQGTIPKDWKKAKIVPIFKKGEKEKAENYRPISLTSICKLLEHIADSKIREHLDK